MICSDSVDKYLEEHQDKIVGVFCIGAHHGQEFSGFRNIGVKNFILFEPIPEHYNTLEKNMRMSEYDPLGRDGMNRDIRYRIENVALGSCDAEKVMYISSNEGQSSSILKPLLHTEIYPGVEFNGEVVVKQTSMDKYIAENNVNIVDFNCMMIDVQGYELEVFKGATNTLKNIDYIITEINNIELYEGCAIVDELDKFLGTFRFERVLTSMVDDDSWGNAIYIKKK